MNASKIIICIFIMALVTYLPRALPILLFQKKVENRFLKSFLAYVPYAVLAAMTFPEILYSTASFFSGLSGLIVAIILAYWGRNLLTVAIGSACAVFVTEQIFRLISAYLL